MKCIKCGEFLPEGTKFCTKCGTNQNSANKKNIEKEDLNHTRILRREEKESLEDTSEMSPIRTEDPIYEVDPYETKKDTGEVLRIKRRTAEDYPKAKEAVPKAKPAFVFPWKKKKKEKDLNSEKFIEEEKIDNPYIADKEYEKEPKIKYYPEHDVPKPSKGKGLLSVPLYLLFFGQLIFTLSVLPFMSYTGGDRQLSLIITVFLGAAVLVIHPLCYRKASKKTGVFLGKGQRHLLKAVLINYMLIPFSGTLAAIFFIGIYNRQTAVVIFAALIIGAILFVKSVVTAVLDNVIYDRGILKRFGRKYRGRFIILFMILPILIILFFGAANLSYINPWNYI